LLSLSYSLVWSSGQSIAVSNTFVAVVVVKLSSSIDCEALVSHSASTASSHSIGLINIMLIGHLTLKVILINELMLLLYLASGLTAVKLLTSLSATACIGPGPLCTQGLTRSLTCSGIFRLFQQGDLPFAFRLRAKNQPLGPVPPHAPQNAKTHPYRPKQGTKHSRTFGKNLGDKKGVCCTSTYPNVVRIRGNSMKMRYEPRGTNMGKSTMKTGN